jgi:hypothetical protein
LETEGVEHETFHAHKMHCDVPVASSMTKDNRIHRPHSDGRAPPPDSKSGGVEMERPYQQHLGFKARGEFSRPADHMRRGGMVDSTIQSNGWLHGITQSGNSGRENLWFVQHLRMRLAFALRCAREGGYDGSGRPCRSACDVLSST